jgi:hypothetical protein
MEKENLEKKKRKIQTQLMKISQENSLQIKNETKPLQSILFNSK